MLTAHIHVCLVSAQAAPNLLPALDPALKPREVILLVSDKMKARADALASVLQEASVKVTRIDLPKGSEHDFKQLEERLLELASQRSADRLALNVTGGTKLMALAAHSIVANESNWEVFYVDVDTDEIIVLGKDSRRQQLSNTLRLPHYLRAYGYEPQQDSARPEPKPRWLALIQDLVTRVDGLQQAIGQLNRIAQVASEHSLSAKLTPDQSRSLGVLLTDFQAAGLLTVQADRVKFASKEHLEFVKGGWLEHHVFRTVGRVSQELGIRDKRTNLCVVDPGGVKNELDVAFMARNRLHVIECKTAKMDGGSDEKANNTLFKLAEIARNVGGLGTHAMLASYRPLDEHEKRLARALNIELVCGSELAELGARLKKWVAM